MIDLHTHSRISDGSDPPQTVVDLAHREGCTHLALTDHDALDGIAAARSRAGELGIGFIAGVEISCSFKTTFHLLVYYLEPGEGPLQDKLLDLQRARDERNRALAAKLAQAGFPITWEELEAEAGGPNLGRPHFAALLVRKGAVESIQEAFDRFLAKGRPFYVPKAQLQPKEAIKLASASGGLAVMAHPLTLGLESAQLSGLLAELSGYGLVGLESYYSRYRTGEREELVKMARSHSLVATGGSDYHGTYKPGIEIATGEGDLEVPSEVIDELQGRLG